MTFSTPSARRSGASRSSTPTTARMSSGFAIPTWADAINGAPAGIRPFHRSPRPDPANRPGRGTDTLGAGEARPRVQPAAPESTIRPLIEPPGLSRISTAASSPARTITDTPAPAPRALPMPKPVSVPAQSRVLRRSDRRAGGRFLVPAQGRACLPSRRPTCSRPRLHSDTVSAALVAFARDAAGASSVIVPGLSSSPAPRPSGKSASPSTCHFIPPNSTKHSPRLPASPSSTGGCANRTRAVVSSPSI